MASKGFSLMELVLAVALTAMIIAGIASLEGSMFRSKGRVIVESQTQAQADFSRRLILNELSEATLFNSPKPGQTSDELSGWKNLDTEKAFWSATMTRAGCSTAPCVVVSPAVTQSWALATGLDMNRDGSINSSDIMWFRICLAGNQLMYYYSGSCASGQHCYIESVCSDACGQPCANAKMFEVAAGKLRDVAPLTAIVAVGLPPGRPAVFEQGLNQVRAYFTLTHLGVTGFAQPYSTEVDVKGNVLSGTQ